MVTTLTSIQLSLCVVLHTRKVAVAMSRRITYVRACMTTESEGSTRSSGGWRVQRIDPLSM